MNICGSTKEDRDVGGSYQFTCAIATVLMILLIVSTSQILY
jgi:hypothetical protein